MFTECCQSVHPGEHADWTLRRASSAESLVVREKSSFAKASSRRPLTSLSSTAFAPIFGLNYILAPIFFGIFRFHKR